MKLTNKFGIPDSIVKAVENDTYSKGASDFSITELLKPPRIGALKIKHKDEMVDDVSDRIWSLYGQIAHTILERAGTGLLTEKRMFADFDGRVVSAQVDTLSLNGEELDDYKFVTAWKFKVGQPIDPEFTAQLNMQLEILRRQNPPFEPKRLFITGLLRDWSKLEAKKTEDYPKKQVVRVPIEMWDRERTNSFILERIAFHEAARKAERDEDLPQCTESERWAKPTAWAVMKGEKAIRYGVCYSEKQANELHMKSPGTRIEFRPGQSIRCMAYCEVSEFCSQNKNRSTK